MATTTAVARKQYGDLTQTVAGKAAAKIHAADKAAEIAERVKDPEAFRRALRAKLHAQCEFAAEYQLRFPHGGDRKSDDFQVDSTDHLKRQEWCLIYGFHDRAVRRWCELAQKREAKEAAINKKCWGLMELWQAANYSSDSVEWYTPADYIEAVHQALGGVDLDPASNEFANATVRAKKFFTAEDDGLKKKWHGRVFLNPPYGKTDDNESLAGAFCTKAIGEYESGNIESCIILVNSLHSQKWQAPLYCYPVCLVDHRIRFVSGDGEQNKNPTFQNIFVYLGKEPARFATAFEKIGYVMERVVARQ
jgi:hypothetical protein